MARVKAPLHGGNVHAASRELGQDLAKLIDFSASINPLGPSPRVWQAISRARQLMTHYPDPDGWELRHALAMRGQLDPEEIVLGNGSTELIDVLPRALNIRRLLIVQPTFSEYAASMERSGGHVSCVYAKRADQYAQPIDDVCRTIAARRSGLESADGIMICNPNSPTGQACSADAIAQVVRTAHRFGQWVIVDEAFADYCPERSVLPFVSSWPRVVVIRSLTKFYALPGLRVGYAVAAPSVIKLFRRHMPPWSINMMGQVAALAAIHDPSHTRKSLRFMVRERERFGTLLAALPGCLVIPTAANYFFVELPRGQYAGSVTEQLRAEGLLIRDCSAVPGANARSVRLAVRSPHDNDRLIRALSRLLLSRGS